MEEVRKMIRVPEKLQPYVTIEDGKVIARYLPEELQKDFDLFEAKCKELQRKYRLADL